MAARPIVPHERHDWNRQLPPIAVGVEASDDAGGVVVGEGIVGGADIVLPAGTYRVQMTGDTGRTIDAVVVAPRELTQVSF